MQTRVAEQIEEVSTQIALSMLRDELNISQTELAVKQPSIARIEQADNDPRLSTLKGYVQALGGELSLNVTLPTGKCVAFHL